ncbi:hypothetical protein Tco_0521099 [Tanacetum coccineum]
MFRKWRFLDVVLRISSDIFCQYVFHNFIGSATSQKMSICANKFHNLVGVDKNEASSKAIVTTSRYVVPTSRVNVPVGRYVVPTSRVNVPAGRYVVPTGKDNVIVSTGRTKLIPAGRTILVLVVLSELIV